MHGNDAGDALGLSAAWVRSGAQTGAADYHVVLTLAPRTPASRRLPLHVCFVIDSSGSMFERYGGVMTAEDKHYWRQVAESRGEFETGYRDGQEVWRVRGRTRDEMRAQFGDHTPMGRTLDALHSAIDGLSAPQDASVIMFADRAVLAVVSAMGLPDVAGRLDGLRRAPLDGIGDGTRLRPALEVALREAERTRADNKRVQIVLVSDGLVHDREELEAVVPAICDARVPVHCFGLGADFDEDLLMWLADLANGQYYYLQTPTGISEVIETQVSDQRRGGLPALDVALAPAADLDLISCHQCQPFVAPFRRDPVSMDWQISVTTGIAIGEAVSFVAEVGAWPHAGADGPLLRLRATDPATGDPYAEEAIGASAFQELDWTGADEASQCVLSVKARQLDKAARDAQDLGQYDEARRQLYRLAELWEGVGMYAEAEDARREGMVIAQGLQADAALTKRNKSGTRRWQAPRRGVGAGTSLECPHCGTPSPPGRGRCSLCGEALPQS